MKYIEKVERLEKRINELSIIVYSLENTLFRLEDMKTFENKQELNIEIFFLKKTIKDYSKKVEIMQEKVKFYNKMSILLEEVK